MVPLLEVVGVKTRGAIPFLAMAAESVAAELDLRPIDLKSTAGASSTSKDDDISERTPGTRTTTTESVTTSAVVDVVEEPEQLVHVQDQAQQVQLRGGIVDQHGVDVDDCGSDATCEADDLDVVIRKSEQLLRSLHDVTSSSSAAQSIE